MADIIYGVQEIECTIPAGTSETSAVFGWGLRLARIYMPEEWDAADLTFTEAEKPSGTFYPLYDDNGIEITILANAERTITVSSNALPLTAMRYFKIRSGTSTTPVNQSAERKIKLLLVD